MTLSRKDRAVTERLSVAIEGLIASIDALSDVISDRTKQLKGASSEEVRLMGRISKLVGIRPEKKSAGSKGR